MFYLMQYITTNAVQIQVSLISFKTLLKRGNRIRNIKLISFSINSETITELGSPKSLLLLFQLFLLLF